MSVDKMLREMVAEEVARAIEPLTNAVAVLQQNSSVVARLASAFGAQAPAARRGPGRPPKAASAVAAAPKAASAGRVRRGRKPSTEERDCAIRGCGRPSRSKGYCAAHYQKFRMLDRTGRLPSDWVADAAPNSVKNLKLPRGRAGAKALAASRGK